VCDKHDCIAVLPENYSVGLLKYNIFYSVVYFSVLKVTRGGGENTCINKEKDISAVMVKI